MKNSEKKPIIKSLMSTVFYDAISSDIQSSLKDLKRTNLNR